MQRKFLLIKVLVALTAVAVQLRLNVPAYSVKLAVTSAGLSIKIARREPVRVQERDVAEGVQVQGNARANIAALARNMSSGGSPLPRPEKQANAPATANQAPSAATDSAQAPASTPSEAHIEFMNIAPEGTSVLAGRAEPGAHITVLEKGRPVGTTVAGADGDWSLATEHHFVNKDPSADLRVVAGGPPAAPPPESTRKSGVEVAAATPSGSPSGPAAHLIQEFANTVAAAREEAAERANTTAVPVQTAEVSAPATNIGTAVQPVPSADAGVASADANSAAASASRAIGNGDDVAATMPARLDPKAPPKPGIIPIPIQFVYRETTLTDDGERAVALLLEYLKLKKYDSVTLSGHADERGTPEFNLDLSRQRLEAVVDILRKGGYGGAVKVLPKGESEPFTGVARDRFDREDLLQLDRRVELRLAR